MARDAVTPCDFFTCEFANEGIASQPKQGDLYQQKFRSTLCAGHISDPAATAQNPTSESISVRSRLKGAEIWQKHVNETLASRAQSSVTFDMDLFLDSGNSADWADLLPTGLFKGITTNPLLTQQAGLRYSEINWADMFKTAADLGAEQIHVQVTGPPETYCSWAEMRIKEAEQAGIEPVIKVPLVQPSIEKIPELKALGARLLLTGCYSAKQALIAQVLGADFVAPYIGRMSESGIDATAEIRKMIVICVGTECSILASSIRSAEMLTEMAALGCPCITISPSLTRTLFDSPLTMQAYAEVEEAARR